MKTVLALTFALILSATSLSPVFAAANPRSKTPTVTRGGLSLTPAIGGYLFDGSDHLDASLTYGLKIGYDNIGRAISDSLGVEGTLNYLGTASKTDGSDVSGYLLRLDIIYPFITGGKWMPFLALGGGGIMLDTASRTKADPLFNYGAGLKYFPEDYLAVRVDARHILVYDNAATRNNFEIGMGLSYYFGKESRKKALPQLPPPAIKPEEKK